MVFFTLLVIPIVIIMAFLWIFGRNQYTWQEALIVLGFGVFVAASAAGINACNGKQRDYQYVNGKVIEKKRERVSCEHSYECNCYNSCSGSGSNQTCTRICSTCYEHSYDIDWAVYFDTPTRVEIDRIDRQGVRMPARWDAVYLGEPGTFVDSYTNYIKGAPDSLFYFQDKAAVAKYKNLPHYPISTFDYYHANKVWDYHDVLGNETRKAWNAKLMSVNAELGPKHQMNIQIFIVKGVDPDYFQALRTFWLGGKKNDILPVFSVDEKKNILWVDVMAWADSYSFNVSLRDSLTALKTLDDRIFDVITHEVQTKYKRKHMREFQYLENMATPTPTFYFWSVLIEALLCIGLSLWFTVNSFTYEDEDLDNLFS